MAYPIGYQADHCPYCGTKLESSRQQKCPSCGKAIYARKGTHISIHPLRHRHSEQLQKMMAAGDMRYPLGQTPDIKTAKEFGCKTMQLECAPDACPVCRKMGGKDYALSQVIEVTQYLRKHCQSEKGCRCCWFLDIQKTVEKVNRLLRISGIPKRLLPPEKKRPRG